MQWEGPPIEGATWKLLDDVLLAYTHLHLEDKMFIKGGRNDLNQHTQPITAQHDDIRESQASTKKGTYMPNNLKITTTTRITNQDDPDLPKERTKNQRV